MTSPLSGQSTRSLLSLVSALIVWPQVTTLAAALPPDSPITPTTPPSVAQIAIRVRSLARIVVLPQLVLRLVDPIRTWEAPVWRASRRLIADGDQVQPVRRRRLAGPVTRRPLEQRAEIIDRAAAAGDLEHRPHEHPDLASHE